MDNEQIAKNFWRDSFGWGSVNESLGHLTLLENAAREGNKPLFEPLWIAFVISYCRPFMEGRGVGRVSENVIPKSSRDLHRMLKGVRNLVIGHSDPGERSLDGIQLNRLKLRVENGTIHPLPTRITPTLELLPMVRDLAMTVFVELGNLSAKWASLLPELPNLSDGRYIFDPSLPEGSRCISRE